MIRFVRRCAWLCGALALAACHTDPNQSQVTLKVAAAENFAPVLRPLAQEYYNQQPWVSIELHFANTAKLEKNLKEGAAYDIYIPARAQSMMALADKDAIIPKSLVRLGFNQLVIIAAADTALPLQVDSMLSPQVRQIAIADPTTHLLGNLTLQALTNMHLVPVHAATPLADAADNTTGAAASGAGPAAPTANIESKLLVLPDEAAVLAAVRDGRAQVGVIYSTLAVADRRVRVLSPLPISTYAVPSYNAAIPRNAPHYEEAYRFLNFLRSIQARDAMQRSGLLVY